MKSFYLCNGVAHYITPILKLRLRNSSDGRRTNQSTREWRTGPWLTGRAERRRGISCESQEQQNSTSSILDKRHDAAASGGNTDDEDVVDKRSRGGEGCGSCVGPRPTVEEWKAHIAEYPLGEQERGWIGKYKHSLAENARASSRSGSHRHSSRGRLDRRSRSRTRGRSGRRSRSRSRGRSSYRPRSRSYSPRADPRCYSSLQAWTRTRGPHPGRREGAWREAPSYLPQEGSRAIVPYTDARVGRRERGHDDVWRREEDPRGQQCVQRSSGYLQQRQQLEGDRHAGNARVLAGQDEDDLLNRYWDTQQELGEALNQATRAAGETAQLRQSNREILARLRMLERSVHGQLQTGTQPRDPAPGTDGSMVRRARREGRPTHAPAQEAEPTLES
ncbi:hypothetical protein PI125_g23575 [Phytophthora idaei]|nr:hypothetical protein PI125_g23575 [Phytophthora idaei]KAG3127482.1 hypothetical protein PI126_g21826 [Phytophthora idaei]